jgi:hypothetical protein
MKETGWKWGENTTPHFRGGCMPQRETDTKTHKQTRHPATHKNEKKHLCRAATKRKSDKRFKYTPAPPPPPPPPPPPTPPSPPPTPLARRRERVSLPRYVLPVCKCSGPVLSCNYYAIITQILRNYYSAIIMQLLCNYYVNTPGLYYYAIIMQLQKLYGWQEDLMQG